MATKKNKKPSLFKVSQVAFDGPGNLCTEEMILTDIEGGKPTQQIIADFGDGREIAISLKDRGEGSVLLLHSGGRVSGRIAVFPVVSNEIEVRIIV